MKTAYLRRRASEKDYRSDGGAALAGNGRCVDGGKVLAWKKQRILRQYFGYASFRKGRRLLIDSILEGRDTLGLCPPGRENPCAFRCRP